MTGRMRVPHLHLLGPHIPCCPAWSEQEREALSQALCVCDFSRSAASGSLWPHGL